MNKAEEYVEKEIAEFTVNTFDGQEDSTYKYIHIDIAKGIALEGVRIAREEERAKRLPINWRSNKEVVALVRSAIKNTREDEINKLQQVDKELAKEIFSRMDSQDPNHNTNSWEKELKKVEVRVRAEIQSIWDSSITNDLFSYKMSNWLKRKTEAQKK